MKDRYWATPIALTRYAPVAQAVIDLALCGGLIATRLVFQTLGNLLLRLRYPQPIDKARVDHPAVAVIGDIGDNEGLRVLSFGTDHRGIPETVPVGKVEIALVMRRGTVNGAGAVVHHVTIIHIDRQLPGWIKRMNRLDAGVEAEFLGFVDQFLGVPAALTFRNERGERRVLGGGREGKRVVWR